MKYKWNNPLEWLQDTFAKNNVTVTELFHLIATNVDSDGIQDQFQSSMELDGYFDPITPELDIECPTCGSLDIKEVKVDGGYECLECLDNLGESWFFIVDGEAQVLE